MYFFIHRAEFDWSWTEICTAEATLPTLWSADIKFEKVKNAVEQISDKGNFLQNIILPFCWVEKCSNSF